MRNATFIIPGVWRPARSLLGRWIRAHSVDERQAESTYVVVVVLAAIGLVLIHILLWTLFREARGSDAMWVFAVIEALVGGPVAAAAFVGWAPAVTVRASRRGLIITCGRGSGKGHIEEGPGAEDGPDERELSIPYDAIHDVTRVDARTFHRHYRRYAETRVFANRIDDELLLLKWNGVPVVIGLSAGDLGALERILTAHAAVESSHVDAA